MQAVAAQREALKGKAVNTFVLVSLMRRWLFVVALALDALGYVTQVAAVRLLLPLFVVQAVVAGSVAVTAVAARVFLRTPINRKAWFAIGGVAGGLVLLAISSGPESQKHLGSFYHSALLVITALLVAMGAAATRLRRNIAVPVLAVVSGLQFGMVAIASRVITRLELAKLVTDPAAYAVAVAGVSAFGFYSAALQVASVTTVTALSVVAQTLIPAAAGVAFMGDQTRNGFGAVAVVGFAIALLCAVALAQYGDVGSPQPTVES